jgi:flavodoxin I
MINTLILYGSSVGNTHFVAEKVSALLPGARLSSVKGITSADIDEYDNLILGTSTWGVGNFQDDFEQFVNVLLGCDLTDKTIALFGCGDQFNYPDTFCDGMGKLYDLLKEKPCHLIGEWPADDYNFSESKALRNGKFVGLAVDEDNEPDLTDYRIDKWVSEIKPFL